METPAMSAAVTPVLAVQTTTPVNIADMLPVAATAEAEEQTSSSPLSCEYTQIVKQNHVTELPSSATHDSQ